MADKAAGDGLLFGREQVSQALSAAQDGLALVLGGMNDCQMMMTKRITYLQDKVDECVSSLEKVSQHVQQTESRQLELLHASEARLQHHFLQHINSANSQNRRPGAACKENEDGAEFANFQGFFSMSTQRPRSALALGQVTPVIQQNLEESTEAALHKCELAVNEAMEVQSKSMESKLRVWSESLQQRFEGLAGSITAQKEQMEVCNSRLRLVEQRDVRNSSDLKRVVASIDLHGLDDPHGTPIKERLVNVEALNQSARCLLEGIEERLSSCWSRLEEGIRRLDESSDEQVNLAARVASISIRYEELESSHHKLDVWARNHLGPAQSLAANMEKISTRFEQFQRQQERLDDDVNKTLRLGRILDDKVEVFDEMERRMDNLSQQAQKLLGARFTASTRCLMCSEEAEEHERRPSFSRPGSASRQGSPPSARAHTTSVLSSSKGGESIVNANFEGASSWTRTTPPRRPQSARAYRTCEQNQDQDLRIDGQTASQDKFAQRQLTNDEQLVNKAVTSNRQRPQSAKGRGNGEQSIVLVVPQVRMIIMPTAVSNAPTRPTATTGPVKPTGRALAQRRPSSARGPRVPFGQVDRLLGS